MGKCLDEFQVEQLAHGTLAREAIEAADDHLCHCETCRLAVAQFRDDEDLFGDIQAAFHAFGAGSEPTEQNESAAIALKEAPPEEIEGYEILAELHRGGQGVVYKAVQKATKRTVALKILLRGASATERQRLRFEREIEVVAGLQHPNIVTIYDSGVSRGRQFYAMEFVDGVPLDQFMAQNHSAVAGRLASRQSQATIELFYRICAAVSYAHQRGVIHRDLKPANILVDAAGEPHILDFGLAKLANTSLPDDHLTATGEFLGTLAYASPEQTRGDPLQIDVRTDVYSLGVIFYELLTGEYPYPVAGPLSAVLCHIAELEPRRPSTVCRDINSEIETIVLKALAKQPERRYQSAEHLTRDLGHYLCGDPIDAKRDSTWYLLRKSIRRYRVVVATAAAFLAVIVTALIVSIFLWRNAVHERDLARQAETSEQSARIAEAAARREEKRHREDAEYHSYTANVAAAAAALQMHDVVEAGQRLSAAPPSLRGWEWREVQGRLDQSRHTFSGHSSYVTVVAISSDGRVIASAGRDDQTVKIWDVPSKKLLASLARPAAAPPVASGDLWPTLAIDPQGHRLAVAWGDGTPRIWDIATQLYVAEFIGPPCIINVLEFSADGQTLAAGARESHGQKGQHIILAWRQNGELLCQIPQEVWRVNDLAFAPDGKTLASARFDGVTLWDINTGTVKLRLEDQPGNDACVAISRDGRLIATAGHENAIHLWDATTGGPVRKLSGHTGPVTSVAFGPDDEILVSGSRDKTARIWSVATGETLRVLLGHRWIVTSVGISGDGRQIVTGAWDYDVKLWNGIESQPGNLLKGHTALVAKVAFTSDGQLAATASWDHTIKLWDFKKRRQIATLSGHNAPVHEVAFSPDGKLLVSGGWNGSLKLWDVERRSELANLPAHQPDARVHAVVFAPSGKWFISGASDNELRIWDVKSHQPIALLSGHTDHIHAVAISPDERWIASAGHYSVKIWDAALLVETVSFPRRMVLDDFSLAFHPDNRRLAAGDVRTLTIWDVLERKPVQLLHGHTDEIHAVAISRDGRRLASAAFDNSIKLWDLAAGREMATLRDQTSHANTVAFSPDGRYLVAGLEDGSVKIWNGGTTREVDDQ